MNRCAFLLPICLCVLKKLHIFAIYGGLNCSYLCGVELLTDCKTKHFVWNVQIFRTLFLEKFYNKLVYAYKSKNCGITRGVEKIPRRTQSIPLCRNYRVRQGDRFGNLERENRGSEQFCRKNPRQIPVRKSCLVGIRRGANVPGTGNAARIGRPGSSNRRGLYEFRGPTGFHCVRRNDVLFAGGTTTIGRPTFPN